MKQHLLNRILPMSLRRQLRQAALRTIPSMRHLDMRLRLAHMARLGFVPKMIVDVGAAQGHWTRMAARIWPAARIFGVDPNASNIPSLEQTKRDLPQFDYLRAFLGPEQRLVRYHDSGDQTSLYEPPQAAASDEAPMVTLDGLLPQLPRAPDFLKLDVQGFELEVLKGGTRAMESCEAALLEVNFLPLFDGTPLAADVFEFMRDRGLECYDVMGIYRRPEDDALGQLDLLFLRARHALRVNSRL